MFSTHLYYKPKNRQQYKWQIQVNLWNWANK